MNSGQMLLTIAGISLLSILILNSHRANTERMVTSYDNESVLNATGVIQSFIEEIQTKAFDENTVNGPVSNTDSLTKAINLGTEIGETLPKDFDDIDDYDNYKTTVSLSRMGDFSINININYVNTLSPQVVSSTPTFSKRIKVSVTNFNLPDTLKFYHIVSY